MLSTSNETVMSHGFNVERFERFSGKLLTMVETLGLNPSQEKAFKDLVRQEVWGLWESPYSIHEIVPLEATKE